MKKLISLRKLYGGFFAIEFDNGIVVPWRVLTLSEYLRYSEEYYRNLYPPSVLEDEIFRLCVKDKTILDQMDFLPAGIISSVVTSIWQYSCPQSVEQLSQDLDSARSLIMDERFKSLHDMVQLVFTAFPSYKLEELYDMEYGLLMKRFALAEKKLLEGGFLVEPVVFKVTKTEEEPNKRSAVIEEAHKRWLIQEGLLAEDEKKTEAPKKEERKNPFWKARGKTDCDSPILKARKNFLTSEGMKKERYKQEETISGHDLIELPLARHEMIKSAQIIYADVLEALAKEQEG